MGFFTAFLVSHIDTDADNLQQPPGHRHVAIPSSPHQRRRSWDIPVLLFCCHPLCIHVKRLCSGRGGAAERQYRQWLVVPNLSTACTGSQVPPASSARAAFAPADSTSSESRPRRTANQVSGRFLARPELRRQVSPPLEMAFQGGGGENL